MIMKRLVSFAASLLLIGSTGLALAQDSTPVAASTTPTHAWKKNPVMEKIHEQIKSQKALIAADLKNGKLTADTAAPLNDKLKSIEEEIRADFKENRESGTKGLTPDQLQAINDELAANNGVIPQ